ncbi:MAG TPA: hypothetical protein PKD53_12665 [Chloroflexaceae bacterium]|nr:hypothetical protein [Chloroflexaceae bacterium]
MSSPTPTETATAIASEPDFALCPAAAQQLAQFEGMVRRDIAGEQRHSFEINLPEAARLLVLGYTMEGHPAACPDGWNCGQGQLHEEYGVHVNGAFIGAYYDQTAGDAWFPAGPWNTGDVVPAGPVTIEVAHLLTGTPPESVSFKLTVCAKPPPTPTPTFTSTSTATATPTETVTPSATSTETPMPTETTPSPPEDTPTPTDTPIPTDTPTPTDTSTPTATATPVAVGLIRIVLDSRLAQCYHRFTPLVRFACRFSNVSVPQLRGSLHIRTR